MCSSSLLSAEGERYKEGCGKWEEAKDLWLDHKVRSVASPHAAISTFPKSHLRPNFPKLPEIQVLSSNNLEYPKLWPLWHLVPD